jgi:tetratricopeptide (TPR) repeat protein
MIIFRYAAFFLLLLGPVCGAAQTGCFSAFYERGKMLYEEADYEAARRQFDAALACDDKPRQNDVADWIEKCRKGDADRLEEQRKLAEQSRRDLELLEERSSRLADSLRTASLRRNREELYAEISRDLLAYRDRLKDVRDWLPHVGDTFIAPQARDMFNDAVERYNEARNALYQAHKEQIRNARLYWESEEIAGELEAVYELALNRIHNRIVLPLNEGVVVPVRDAALGKTSRITAHKKAKKNAGKALEQLARPILELEQRTNDILSKLK